MAKVSPQLSSSDRAEFLFKRLDKLNSQAKTPAISGKRDLRLVRPTVIARFYDFNPAVATPREEKHHE
jgi:hypothetical protein